MSERRVTDEQIAEWNRTVSVEAPDRVVMVPAGSILDLLHDRTLDRTLDLHDRTLDAAAIQLGTDRIVELERAVDKADDYHGKTVRVIGSVLGIDPAVYGEPDNFLAAVATVVRTRDEAKRLLTTYQNYVHDLRIERDEARGKLGRAYKTIDLLSGAVRSAAFTDEEHAKIVTVMSAALDAPQTPERWVCAYCSFKGTQPEMAEHTANCAAHPMSALRLLLKRALPCVAVFASDGARQPPDRHRSRGHV